MHSVWRRSSGDDEGRIPSRMGQELLSFYLGLKLDGYDRYENLSDLTLELFVPPIIHRNKEVFHVYPKKIKPIFIKVPKFSA